MATPSPAAPATGASGRRTFSGLLPDHALLHRKPRLWQEILLIAVAYWIYTKSRNAIAEDKSLAIRHGHSVQKLQDAVHLNFERSVNNFVARTEWLAQIMNYYYATLHFIVPIAVLVWLFRWHPRVYRGARTVLFATTIVALFGFYFYPLAPPRLLPEFGYVDTLSKYHTWGSLADPKVAEHSNQYAAMPSLHIGWSLWCAFAVYFCARRLWVRLLALMYPVCTLMVIVGTANHFVIDAFGGAAALFVGFVVQRLMSGHGPFAPAPEAALTGKPTPRVVADNPAPDKSAQRVVEDRLDDAPSTARRPPIVVEELASVEAGWVSEHPPDGD